ncbi:hypothetical protein L6249_01560 [Candidatus Parcubacteria bacterium]|nr:hypothetical protein [Patescibacteria group bacterium]MCG2690742.1 hypothetical protein [Candidatus Parcubacteria bacterium]
MLEYIQKFNNLPKDLRDKVSAPAVMFAIEELEKRYEANLAATVMKIMVKEIDANNAAEYLMNELGISGVKAKQIERELRKKVFFNAADYLGIKKADEDENEQIDDLIAQAARKENAAKPVPAQSADFYFHPEDEEEIRELAKKTDGCAQGHALADNIEGKLDEIIKKTKINFGSAILVERFKQILKTYLRGIRDKISIKQTLTKPFDSGGLGFDNDSVDHVLLVVDGVMNNASQDFAAKQTLSQALGVSGVRGAEYDLASELKKKDFFKMNKLDTGHELAPPPPALSPPRLSREAEPQARPVAPQTEPLLTQNIRVKPLPVSDYAAPAEQVIIKRPDVIKDKVKPEGKVKMEDVKFMPKVFGPVDELQYMDLASFRRLAKNPANIIEKIKEKINLLEEDSFVKRLEGIKAWRSNPINRLYLQMGQAGISENKPINAIIEERQAAGQECLNNQEFEAVTDLNRELRF